MKSPVFATICVILFAAYLQFFSMMRYKFSGINELRSQIAHLKSDLEKERFKSELVRYELQDYRQHVATLVPQAVKGKENTYEGFQIRSLASVVAATAGQVNIERASSIFERAREAFRAQKFEESNRGFEKLTKLYPESVYLVEASFLLAEGYYQVKNYEGCLRVIDEMTVRYPDNELTGFALLRLGKIFESQDRKEDAADVYHAVLRAYGDETLRKQATAQLRSVEL